MSISQNGSPEDTVESLRKRVQELEHILAGVNGQLKSREARYYDVQNRLKDVYNSLSWRLTAPLRQFADWFARISGVVVAANTVAIPNKPLNYDEWIKEYDLLGSGDKEKIVKHIAKFDQKPLLSVLMPVYNTPEQFLRLAIESVINQLYPYWELCIADDASTEDHVSRVLEEYQKSDARIKVTNRKKNGHISASSNSALELVCGDFIVLLDHDDELSSLALYLVALEINRFPDVNIIYSDEDKIDESGNRFGPYFKSDWNPDLFYSQNMISHLGVYRSSIVKEIGGFRLGYEGSQDYDLCLRCVARSQDNQVRHIPFVLYHWRAIAGSTAQGMDHKPYAENAAIRALQDHFMHVDSSIRVSSGRFAGSYNVVYPLPSPPPLVSLIIPTRDCYNVLKKCIESILAKTDYPNYEIVIVDNQSTEQGTLDYFKQLSKHQNVRIISYDASFNYSKINNWAVSQVNGELIALINNDIEVISSNWLSELVQHAVRPQIGAVGAKLLYPDGTVQHGGVILGMGGVAGHAHHRFYGAEAGYFGRLALPQNLSAVTAACLVVRREIFQQVGGFEEEHLSVAFNDIDFCLRIREAGYRNLWTPFSELYHHESYSRGFDDTQEKKQRFSKEIAFMVERWGWLLTTDPFYNPNLSLDYLDFSLAWPPRVLRPWLYQ